MSLGLASEVASATSAAAASPSAAPASSSPPAASSSPSSSSGKPKRDAGLSFSSYHGPSHKYLPPAYEGHQLSYHGGGGGGYHSYTTDFGHLESESGSGNGGHHYGHHGYGYGLASPAGHGRPHHHQHYVPSPKIETYIVQTTSSGSGSGHGYHGHSGSHIGSHSLSHGPSHGLSHSYSHGSSHGLGYKYPAPASSAGGPGSSAYLNLLGGGHKTSTYLVASPEFSGGSLHRPSHGYSSHGPAPTHGYSHGFGHGYGHHPISTSSSHGPASHVDHGLEHALEHGLSQALGLGLGHSSGGGGGAGGGHGGPVFAQHPLPQPAEEHSGYTYDAPATPFGKGTPLSSYGVPLIPGYDHHQQESLQEQVLEQEHKLEREPERETPIYALGHKGLGHFSYTASKPQALHTDVLGAGNGGVTHSELELSKAPFKPSAFLGAKHESSGSSGPVTNSISGYDYATPTSPYLQAPSSPGYDYQAPAQLYGPPGHSGDSATPIFEPEATYLPPASSYGPPATSSHGYH
ncbi:hypothetical protein KR059_008730 [Drosophila kikkawai]|nr:hypothetical protein KR059_008730 [Drosophila kikkawai]